MQIRPFGEADRPALARLYAAVYPEAPRSEAELTYLDGRFTLPYRHARWVAERAGELLGWSEFAQHAASYQPQKFALEIAALPSAEAVRAPLYDALLAALAAYQPSSLTAETNEAQLPFYLARGFAEVKRNWTLRLGLDTFDDAPYRERLSALSAAGYTFSRFAELEQTSTGTVALYELLRDLVADVPRLEPRRPWSLEQFLEHRRNSPVLFPEGSLVVHRGEELIGVSELKRTSDPAQLLTSLTAVRREFRGQGLALGTKVETLRHAKTLGFKGILTQNASSNVRMLALNEALGFVKTATRVELLKTL